MSQCIFNLPISEFCFRNPWFSFYEYHESICHVSAFISSWSLCFSNLNLIPTFCFFWLLLPPHFYCEAFSFHVIIFQLIESYFYCFTKCPQIYFYSYFMLYNTYLGLFFIFSKMVNFAQTRDADDLVDLATDEDLLSLSVFGSCTLEFSLVLCQKSFLIVHRKAPQSSISNWRVFVLVCTEKKTV